VATVSVPGYSRKALRGFISERMLQETERGYRDRKGVGVMDT